MSNKAIGYFLFVALFFFSLASAETNIINNTGDVSECGVAFELLKSSNQALSDDRDDLKRELNGLRQYKNAFFALLVLFIVLILMYFNVVRKLKDSRRS